jgi:hypothetical protein
MDLEQKAEYTYWNELGIEHRKFPGGERCLWSESMSEQLADLLRFSLRHLLPMGQLQLWRLRLRDLINFCDNADERRIA